MNIEQLVLREKEKNNSVQKCYFCNAEEGKPRILGGFTVELQKVQLKNGETVYACQSCSVHHRKDLKGNDQKKKRILDKVKDFLF